jgi:hypothetical protein
MELPLSDAAAYLTPAGVKPPTMGAAVPRLREMLPKGAIVSRPTGNFAASSTGTGLLPAVKLLLAAAALLNAG